MRIVYWARAALGREQIVQALQAVPGAQLQVPNSLDETLRALPGAQALALFHGPQSEARPILEALRAPGNTVRWLHFISAGREGYEELGWPSGVIGTASLPEAARRKAR